MTQPGGDDPKSGGDFDRMSLNSLKRELEVQKARTETAREEAHGRIHEAKKSSGTPWKLILAITGGALVLLVVGAYFGRNYIASLGVPMPAFVPLDLPDAGEWSLPPMPEQARSDAGVAEEGRRRPTKRQPTKQPNLDFGDSNDPIEGLDDEL